MKLHGLTAGIQILSGHVPEDLVVSGLCYDSRKIRRNELFFALRGTKVDGHEFLPQIAADGAACAVVENSSKVPNGLPYLCVANVRHAMALIAGAYYGAPTASRPLFGVTGTNGKTTTTYLLEGILAAAEIPAAVLGTISYRYGATLLAAEHTTPESVDLQAAFRTLADAGAKSFVMEVSSHALEQYRADGCHFDLAIFTNLTRDHLDYHGTMDAYLQSKLRLFRDLLTAGRGKGVRTAVINADDPAAEFVLKAAAGPVITYGTVPGAAVTVRNLQISTAGIRGVIVSPVGETAFSSSLIGRYNLSNLLGAAAAGIAYGLPLDVISRGIENCRTVPGRLQPIDNDKGVTVLVDYAHTGDALENVLKTMTALKTGRLICVFGCGGDRDRGKRPVMGEIAARYSDLIVVTSDNPRTENPDAIIAEIESGIAPLAICRYDADTLSSTEWSEHGYTVIPDRRQAIRTAITVAAPGDIVLLAGKGHEDYQIFGTTKYHFDDREEAAAALAAGRGA